MLGLLIIDSQGDRHGREVRGGGVESRKERDKWKAEDAASIQI